MSAADLILRVIRLLVERGLMKLLAPNGEPVEMSDAELGAYVQRAMSAVLKQPPSTTGARSRADVIADFEAARHAAPFHPALVMMLRSLFELSLGTRDDLHAMAHPMQITPQITPGDLTADVIEEIVASARGHDHDLVDRLVNGGLGRTQPPDEASLCALCSGVLGDRYDSRALGGLFVHQECAPTPDEVKSLGFSMWPLGEADWTKVRDLRIAAIPEAERCGHLWGGPMGRRCVGRVKLYANARPDFCRDSGCAFNGKPTCGQHECIPF